MTSQKFTLLGKKFEELMKRGIVPKESLLKESGFSEEQIKKMLGRDVEGGRIFEQRVEKEIYYRLIRETPPVVTQERVWQYAQCADRRKPYFWFQFPNTDWKKIILVPLSDLQWGSEECDVAQLKDYVKYIGENDHVFAFLNGDILNNALPDSPGGSIFWDVARPREQVRTVIDLLAPIAHKILWALPGNHEERTIKRADIDPLFWICQKLGIPYSDQPIFADILWRSHRFNFYCFHGISGSRTMGGKLNAAMRPIDWTEFTMFYIMGHVHEPMGNPVTRRCVLREYDSKGGLTGLRVVDRDQYVIICAAWLKFWGGYGAKMGFSPQSQGGTPCLLYKNGDYGISE
ncbi:MAG: hypothetical protein A2931_00615 [Candidatus Niyogibacteria bacterium RIFCSPLOWO2_01_FULL_45_48]|uniref:Calcineurin-like phosphoesterase domain-containing protein n=2 Tax=Candidatus Niyogiibacteriota TaxID=1817912 RepID=A0A1G2F0M7_9BACT|nr:MAG: hypothetical protein A2931_00615 [Candidatus Niyogibacteria bacterium RIFCSPLOWO2_01_FULL_45_48]OGZ30587.1 MAG: hypothetical protein A2835_01915 [Candidatus Niyogibacteria bacterium RIFCSPHIGHO2_01_FULL_45_28]OGZ31625.1 MAG: hypothetical protein A3J00_00225 [Candidatus Niyogibacteria bacterium RIFCSPLOWO2_02_FULL_45_13]